MTYIYREKCGTWS